MDKKLVGIFQTEAAAILAIDRLKVDGYTDDEISVLARQKDKLDRIADVTDTGVNKESIDGAAGGVAGALIDLGINQSEEYANYLDEGHIIVMVDDKDNRESVYTNFYENESLIRDRYNTDIR